MPFDFGLRTTFNNVAELYDEVRPGYPEALIEDALTLSEIPPDGRILEIGCGTGKATLPFARRGYAIVIFVDDAPQLPKWATCKKLLTNQKSYAMMVTMPETFPVSLPQP